MVSQISQCRICLSLFRPDERVSRYLQAKDYNFDVLNDTSGQIGRDWAISVTPTIAIIKDGEIKSITTGVTTPLGIWLRAALHKPTELITMPL